MQVLIPGEEAQRNIGPFSPESGRAPRTRRRLFDTEFHGPGALPPSWCLDPGEKWSIGGERKNGKEERILGLEGEPARKWIASVSRKTRPSEAGRGVCLTDWHLEGKCKGRRCGLLLGKQISEPRAGPGRQAPAHLPHLPVLPSPRRPLVDPGFIDVVHIERNFTRPSALLFLPRCPPACLSLQREPGVRWPRSSPAASETSYAVSASARGRGADLARRLWAREGRAAVSPPHPHQRSRRFLAKDGRERGSRAPRVADRRALCLSQPCSTETPRRRRRAAGASPRGPPPGRPPAPATRSPAAAPKPMSTMRFYTQQVKARGRAPWSHCRSLCPAHRTQEGPGAGSLTRDIQLEGGGGPYENLHLKYGNARLASSVRTRIPASAWRLVPAFRGVFGAAALFPQRLPPQSVGSAGGRGARARRSSTSASWCR